MDNYKRINETVEKIKNNKLTIGSWIQLADPTLAKLMASCGFDWLTVDLEHGRYSMDTVPLVFDAIRAEGCLPLARLALNTEQNIKLALDAGAGGIIVPMINTPEEAETAVKNAKYPPVGSRGIGFSNACKYGMDFDEYFKNWNSNSVVIVQIESIEGAGNLEKILQVEGVDGFITGPYDLSGSMGLTGKFEHPEFIKTMEQIEKTGRESGKAFGAHVVPSVPDKVTEKIHNGCTFIAYSIDTVVLHSHFSDAIKKLRKISS